MENRKERRTREAKMKFAELKVKQLLEKKLPTIGLSHKGQLEKLKRIYSKVKDVRQPDRYRNSLFSQTKKN
jgi:hypothetical protein